MEIEERAKNMGWTPQEDFRGNPDNWVDAETFVGRAETSLPIAKGTIKRLESEVKQLRQNMAEFAEFHRGSEERAFNRAMQTLKKQQIEAVELGDTEKFKAIQSDIDDMVQNHPIATGKPKVTAPQEDMKAIVSEWIKSNPWYEDDDEMADYAMRIDTRLRNLHPDKDPREHLELVTEKVKLKFSDRFDNGNNNNKSRRNAVATVEGGDNFATVNVSGKKGYANLPPDAKSQCDKFVADKLLTREQYVKDYFG